MMTSPTRPILSTKHSQPNLHSTKPEASSDSDLTSAQAEPQNNTAAFSHNATFPPPDQSRSSIPGHLKQIPDFTIRKASVGGGLHLHTQLTDNTQVLGDQIPEHAVDETESSRPRTPTPIQHDIQRLTSRTSWGSSAGGSPSSSSSSPAFAALKDVTPLPSPAEASFSTETWMSRAARPHSASNASVERDKAAGLLSPVISISPQRRKKAYGTLGTPPSTSHEANGTPERIRAHSEYVPDQLQNNVKARVVTNSHIFPIPTNQVDSAQNGTSMHRELFFAKSKPSIDRDAASDSGRLPELSQNNHALSDEGNASSFLTVNDAVTDQTTSWRTLKRLGNGSFSEVVLATRETHTNALDSSIDGSTHDPTSLVAIKIVSHSTSRDEERMDTSIKREIEILQSMSHPCLPQLLAFEDNASRALLVMNYCPGGDLFEVASQQRDLLTTSIIQRIFAEMVAAVSCLHQALIVHRDIKLENVLLNFSLAALPQDPRTYAHPLITLIDLGLAKHIPAPPASPMLSHPCGSVDYAAPEVLMGLPYDGRATDAWALGVLLYSLMEGRLPFDALPNSRRRAATDVRHRIARCDWLWCEYGDKHGDWDDTTPQGRTMQGAKEIIEGLLRKVHRGRWSLERVASSAWVKDGMKLDDLLSRP